MDWTFAEDITSSVSRAECQKLAELAAATAIRGFANFPPSDPPTGCRVLEVGCLYGRSTIALASTAKVVFAVDHHSAIDQFPAHYASFMTQASTFLANLDRYGVRSKVVPVIAALEPFASVTQWGSFDLIFLDAHHEREFVEKDLATVLPLLRAGGTIAFHDYGVPGYVDETGTLVRRWSVTELVDDLAKRNGCQIEQVETLAVMHGVTTMR